MDWKESHRRLVTSLRDEVRKSWGHIAELEDRLSLSDGYLNKLCSGRNEFKLDLFLETIGALGLDHRTFFSRALEIQAGPDDYLKHLEDPDVRDRAFSKISKATRELVEAEAPPACQETAKAESLVAEVTSCSRKEQARRMRHTHRYRTHAFTHAYLEHLDALRDEDAVAAARLVTVVATHLIPELPGPQSARLALQCRALGIFASARRLKGEFTSAARALRLAVDIARNAQLHEETALMLRRAAYLLRDFGHFERALCLLREALEIYVDLGLQEEIAHTSVERGITLMGLGDYESTIFVLERALASYDAGAVEAPRYLFAAYQSLAYVFEQRGDLDAAELQLRKATRLKGLKRGFYWARLRWMQGTLAFKRGRYQESADYLAAAREALAKKENVLQEAMVTIDLLTTLLAQGRFEEACEQATAMAQLVERFRKNRFAEVAVVQLVRAGLEGTLSQKLLGETRVKLSQERSAPSRGASRTA